MKEMFALPQLKKVLRDCLQSAPFVKAVEFERPKSLRDVQVDLVGRIILPEGRKLVLAECKSNGQPRFARQAMNQLSFWKQRFPESYGVFVAPYVSPESARICEEAGMGYVDLAGNCLLSFDRVYIRVEGKENPFPQNRDLRTLFSPKASRVLRALLQSPFKSWKVQELREQAGVSLGQVANVKKLLLDREWAKANDSGFALSQPEALLREWASNYDYRKNQRVDFYSLNDGLRCETELSEYCSRNGIRFALTMFSGAARFAPYTRFQRIFAYVERGVEEVRDALELKAVASGPNLTLMVPYDAGVFLGAKTFDRIPVVSPLQLYLDLKSYKGRGEEAAEFLFEKVIQPQWSQKQTMVSEK